MSEGGGMHRTAFEDVHVFRTRCEYDFVLRFDMLFIRYSLIMYGPTMDVSSNK